MPLVFFHEASETHTPTPSIAAKKLHLHSRPCGRMVLMKVRRIAVLSLLPATVNLNHRPWSVSFKAGRLSVGGWEFFFIKVTATSWSLGSEVTLMMNH